jgi:hypothetical protein
MVGNMGKTGKGGSWQERRLPPQTPLATRASEGCARSLVRACSMVRRMRMADYQLDVALPVLARAAREWGPWPALDALVEDLTRVAHRRGLIALLAQVERQARGEEMVVRARENAPPRHGRGVSAVSPERD